MEDKETRAFNMLVDKGYLPEHLKTIPYQMLQAAQENYENLYLAHTQVRDRGMRRRGY